MKGSPESLRRLMARLETSFDAAVSAAEDAAASDLAVALDRGMELAERLQATRGALEVLLPDGVTAAVSVVGSDHLVCGDPPALIIPVAAGVTTATTGGSPPAVSRDTLMQALRPWADRRSRVEVTSSGGTRAYVGKLVAAGPDHVLLERETGRVMIPLALVGPIRLVPAG